MAITINSALKRDVLLQTAMRAFKNRILPILAFATKFDANPLQGTNVITVPYISLASGASTDFVAGTGYTTENNQTIGIKQVTVNKRKYRMVGFTSDEWNRQPFLKQDELIGIEAEKLADDVLADVWSLLTAANFAGTTLAAGAASAFDLDEVLALRRLCSEANWPLAGRNLLLDSTFWENLHKDTRLGNQNYGSAGAVIEGRIQGKIGGFQPYEVPLVPANGLEKIAGFVALQSAILFASAPITPHPILQRTLVDYSKVTDPDSGLTLEYRAFGDATLDKVKEVIEVNYGYSVGEATALKRIITP